MEFKENGTYSGEYGGGACTQTGSWSLSHGQTIRTFDSPVCDRRSGGEMIRQADVRVTDDFLYFEGTQYSPDPKR
jgi:hypothetical protein